MDDYEIAADFQRQGIDFPYLVIREARQRLRLKPNKPQEQKWGKEGAIPKGKPDPLAVAQAYLPGFDRETMTLNGREVKLDEAIRRTNAILKSYGMKQIDANPIWVQ